MSKIFEIPHYYLDAHNYKPVCENLYADGLIKFLYSSLRENSPLLFKILTSCMFSKILAYINFDIRTKNTVWYFKYKLNINFEECFEPLEYFDTPRKIFERKIRYWEMRPMPQSEDHIVCPCDAKVLAGSLNFNSHLYIKNKFFSYEELLLKEIFIKSFDQGDFVICRLTPEKYHYTHFPVSGKVIDFYSIQGQCHSCNPGAVVEVLNIYSKNKRVISIIDTDVPGGSNIGLVAIIEIAALMIGDIHQCVCYEKYENPQDIKIGMLVKRGIPKSLFRPGGSTVILIFQKDKLSFTQKLSSKQATPTINRYIIGFNQNIMEIDMQTRELIGIKK